MLIAPALRPQPRSCSACSLRESFCDLSSEARAAFDRLKTTVAYRRNEVIFHEGDTAHSVVAVCDGTVKLMTASSDGRALLLRLARRGEMLGLVEAVLGSDAYEFSAVAIEPAVVAVVARDTFMRFVNSYPEACVSLTVALSRQYLFAQRETKFLAFQDPTVVRLAHLLLDWSAEARPEADGLHIPLHLTHADFAQAIGSTRETVTRVLGSLAHAGLVERRSEEIVIHHPAELALVASSAIRSPRGVTEMLSSRTIATYS